MIRKVNIKNILSVLAVPVLGFLLLNLTFIFDYLVQSSLDKLIQPESNGIYKMFPGLKHLIFIIIIIFISWLIFKSKLRDIYKAIFSVVPTAVIFVTIWIFLYQWPIYAYIISAVIFISMVFYLYKTKKSWLYYYAVVLTASVLLGMGLLRIDI